MTREELKHRISMLLRSDIDSLMKLIDKYVEGVTAEKVLEGKIAEVSYLMAGTVVTDERPDVKMTNVLNKRLEKERAFLQSELSKMKSLREK